MNRMNRPGWMWIVVAIGVALSATAAMAHPGGHGGESPFGRRPIGGEGKPIPIQLVSAPRAGKGLADVAIAEAFAPFEKLEAITTRRDADFFYVEGQGVPDHPLMIGIRAWQQQVPLPQPYVGDNAWRIPLEPVPAKKPASAKNRFLRGAIALAVNGIPIFNPLNNRGEDAYAIGELDDYGGQVTVGNGAILDLGRRAMRQLREKPLFVGSSMPYSSLTAAGSSSKLVASGMLTCIRAASS